VRLALIAATTVALAGATAYAQTVATSPGHLTSYANTELGSDNIPVVSRGDRFAIACASIEANGADVRVVMKLDNPPGDRPTGYNAVLATDTTIVQHSVNVHVPDVPDLANHTVDVKVYVTDAKGTRACDAGRIRVV
jgi:hypothetical protein